MLRLLLRSVLLTGALLAGAPLLPGFLVAEQALASGGIEDQAVVVNAQVAVDVPFAFGNISVGSSTIARVEPMREARQLLILGREAGTTNVIVYDTRGTRKAEFEVTVVPANLTRLMKTVQELLDDIEGLKFKIVNDRILVSGEVSLDSELKRVKDLDEREPMMESMVELSPVAQRLLAGLIEKEIGLAGVKAHVVRKKILLEGIVHSEAASKRAEAIAKAYDSEVVNVLEVKAVDRTPGRTSTIVMVVHFVELTKSLIDSWGVEWTPLTSQGGLEYFWQREFSGGSFAAPTGYVSSTVNALLPRLERARSSGYARVLENPTVSVKSGDTAHIFSGAKVPFVFIENGTQTVVFEQVGIRMDVTAYAQGNDVDLKMDIGVSSLGEVAPNGYPSINNSEITTSQYCRAGESIVVGGLERISDRTDYNRVPASPAVANGIITLYRSKNYKKSKSQFLVFITPQVHESSTTANREIQDKFNLSEVRQ